MTFRAAAFTLPWSASFHQTIADLPMLAGSGGSVKFPNDGEVQLVLPVFYPRLGELISDTAASLVRIYDDDVWVQDFLAERVASDVNTEQGTIVVSGPDIGGGGLSRTVLYPYDWPRLNAVGLFESLDPDWKWGQESKISDPSFEAGNNLIAENYGFEDGTTEGWWAGAVAGVSATLTVEPAGANVDTGSFAAKCVAILLEGGMTRAVSTLTPGKTYTVTARVKAPNGQNMQIGCTGAAGMGVGTADRIADVSNSPADQDFEAQKNFVGTGAYQTVTFNFVSGPEIVRTSGTGQTRTQISIRTIVSGTNVTFYVDNISITGFGGGMGDWKPTDPLYVTTMESSADFAYDGSRSAKITAEDWQGIYLEERNARPGGTYSATVRVRNTTGSARWALQVEDLNGTMLGAEGVATSTTWQLITLTVTLPDVVPGSTVRLFLRNVSGAAATVYADVVTWVDGRPAATIGEILIELFDDAAVDHALDVRGIPLFWLDYSTFSASLDSEGQAWGGVVSFTAYRGMTYLQVMDRVVELGYEWEIVPKAVPSGGKTHDLRVCIGQGLGVVRVAADSPTISAGQGIESGPIVRRLPGFTSVLVEGAEQTFHVDSDPTAVTNFGQAERYFGDRGLRDVTSRTLAADTLLAGEASNRTAAQVTIKASDDHPRPLVAYRPADTVYWQFPPLLAKQQRRVRQIDWQKAEPDLFTVTGSKIFPGETGQAEVVARLLRRFDPFDALLSRLDPAPAVEAITSGGRIPWLIAAADSTAAWKSAAGYVCTGTSANPTDTAIFQLALSESGVGGEVWLAPGNYYASWADLGSSGLDGFNNGCTFVGLGHYAWNTQLHIEGSPGTFGTRNVFNRIAGVRNFTISESNQSNPDVVVVQPSAGGFGTIIDMTIFTGGTGIFLVEGSDSAWVERCYVETSGEGAFTAGIKIFVGAIQGRIVIKHNQVNAPEAFGIYAYNNLSGTGFIQAPLWLEDNEVRAPKGYHIESGIRKWNGVTLLGNKLIIDFGATATGAAYKLIRLERPQVVGNTIDASFLHGFHFELCNDGSIHDNIAYQVGETAANTYDAFHLTNDCNRNTLRSNTVRSGPNGAHRYGIRINTSDCDGNIVILNDLTDPDGSDTGPFSDLGTGTITTIPTGSIGANFG